MKAVIGIDTAGNYVPALELYSRLSFADAEAVLLNCVESVLPDGSFPSSSSGSALARMIDEREELGRQTLRSAGEALGKSEARALLVQGDPLRMMLSYADKESADLLVSGTERKGTFESFLLGSVTRGILTGSKQNLLVGKAPTRGQGPVDAVLATDHSEYSNRCIERLLELAPKGFGRITVLTVFESSMVETALLVRNEPSLAEMAGPWLKEHIEEANLKLCERLSPLCQSCDQRVVEGDTNKAISEAMVETNAELLIVGSQGHGFIERLTIGSVAFHQVVAEPYSVLVLRA